MLLQMFGDIFVGDNVADHRSPTAFEDSKDFVEHLTTIFGANKIQYTIRNHAVNGIV